MKALRHPAWFCAVVGTVTLLAELWAALLVSPAFRQIVLDLPLLKLLWQTALLLGAYVGVSVVGGILLVVFVEAIFSKKFSAEKGGERVLGGLLLFLYAFWAWRREILPKNFPVLTLLLLGSLLLPLLFPSHFLRKLSQGKFFFLLCLSIFASAIGCRLGGSFFTKESPRSTSSPNVLILSVDTIRPDHLSCYGYQKIKTPAIDRLAAEGTLFEQAICQIPLTGPSFASILTGTYPQTHGSRYNLMPLRKEAITLAEVLKEKGYRTAAFLSGYPLRHFSGLDQGFDFYQDRFSFFDGFKLLRVVEPLGWVGLGFQQERRASEVDGLFLPWLKRHSERPFFVWIHYFDPHMPYRPPSPARRVLSVPLAMQNKMHGISEKEVDLEMRHRMIQLYDGEIVYTDQSIGRILSSLESSRLLDKTLVVLISDHGESFEHGYLFDHADKLYDSTIHIALIFRHPSLIPKGKRYPDQVQSIDLVPTLLTLLKYTPPVTTEGRAIDVSTGKGSAPFAYFETRGHALSATPRLLKGLRTRRWKYVASLSDQTEELYDLQKDPGETANLAQAHPEEVRNFRRILSEWMSRDKDPQASPSLSSEQRQILKSLGYLQ